jgi:hypothetical protein
MGEDPSVPDYPLSAYNANLCILLLAFYQLFIDPGKFSCTFLQKPPYFCKFNAVQEKQLLNLNSTVPYDHDKQSKPAGKLCPY